jgi:hypothetical protein
MRALLLTNVALAILLSACVDTDDDNVDLDETSSEVFTIPTGPLTTLVPAESTADIINPERGYYTGYNLVAAGSATSIRTNGYSLAIAIVNLQDYRDRSLDAALLTSLTNGFARARAAGIKLVLRFAYNNSASADASKSRILGHIGQLSPLLHDNADVIAVMQAGFIGAWGEWHSSTNGLDTDAAHADVLLALLSALPSSRSVQVRRPNFKDTYRPGALTAADAYTGSSRSRIGHHNDCFLASATDMGTYSSPVSTWMSYVAQDTLYAPMGGETCAVYAARSDCAPAVAEMESKHWSYLNRMYNGTVISRWGTQGCDATIKQRLGYRFVIRRVAHSASTPPGGVLALELDIRNRGFAVPFNQRPIEVVLINGSVRRTALLSFDARRLPAGAKTTIKTYLRIPANLAPGTYTLALRMPDPYSRLAADPRYAIQMANTGVWDAATGDNVLTRSLVIDAAAPGSRDTSATSFVELH